MATIEDKVFDRLFKEAEIATFTPEELREYEDSLKAYRDIKNSIDSARREGRAEGLAEGLMPVPAHRHRETFFHLIGSYGYILYGR